MTPKKILIVDDSKLIHQICKTMLMRYGDYTILDAENGHQALEVLFREGRVDLILLDINMPVMSGVEFMEKLRKSNAYSGTPIIVISTEREEKSIEKVRSLGAWAYVAKPRADSLAGLIVDALNNKPSPLLPQ